MDKLIKTTAKVNLTKEHRWLPYNYYLPIIDDTTSTSDLAIYYI